MRNATVRKVVGAALTLILIPVLVWWLTSEDGPIRRALQTPTPTPSPQARALWGDWAFDRMEKGNLSGSGFDVRPKSLRFFENGDYISTFVITMPPGNTVESQSSGRYTFVGTNRIKFEASGDQNTTFSIVDFLITGNELRIIDPSYVVVYRKA